MWVSYLNFLVPSMKCRQMFVTHTHTVYMFVEQILLQMCYNNVYIKKQKRQSYIPKLVKYSVLQRLKDTQIYLHSQHVM